MVDYNKNHPESIKKMFGSIANKYDKTNSILSLNMHKYWNRKLVHALPIHKEEQTFLDLCCGTGDIAYSFLSQVSNPQRVIMVDFCPEMLQCAKNKAHKLPFSSHQIEYIQSDVQTLPLKDQEVTCASIAYGIRNVQCPLQCFQEVFRVLKPGGVFGILELTNPTNPVIRLGHKFYLQSIVPLVGKWVTSNQQAYEYLCDSIPKFSSAHNLPKLLDTAGFSDIQQKSMTFGTATLFVAQKN